MSHALARHTTQLREWWDGISRSGSGLQHVKTHVQSTGHVLRSTGESVVVGGLLAYAGQKLGSLDYTVKGHSVPLDGLVGLAGMIGAVAMAREEHATDLRNAGAAGLAICSYRKTQEYLAKKAANGSSSSSSSGSSDSSSKKGKAAVHGDIGTVGYHGEPAATNGSSDDAIIAAARALG